MKKELYESLTPNEKLMYDEFVFFTKTVVSRLDALTEVIQKLMALASEDPQ